MRKQALIHMHALAVELRAAVSSSRRNTPTPDAFVEYDDGEVTPATVYHQKDAHKAAVQLLLEGTVETIRIDTESESESRAQSQTTVETVQPPE
ncbi:UPF0058 family protein [Halobacteria archaeon AArc-m2/3/4]|uniref:UPF0058 family protein n=1 Tax=Natronoglomus mannanivorans TaxID=2979990 RepID=A0ABT2QD23_9EURY|nr:UPF0058 family protein [Halobacteria archaeon AArc-m2/3/4]